MSATGGTIAAAAASKWCCLCRQPVTSFLPYAGGSAKAPPLMMALDAIGSDVDNFSCPNCGAHDRERHLFLYMERLGLLQQISGKAVLHFAPERVLTHVIEAAGPGRYVMADLEPRNARIEKINVLDIPYPDASFDLVLANHILEHVVDDRKALSEILRVLKPSGLAIMQTPFSAKLHMTLDDPGVDTDAARTLLYGEAVHLRLYGRDIFDRFAAAGFTPLVKSHHEILPDLDVAKYGVNGREPFFLFTK